MHKICTTCININKRVILLHLSICILCININITMFLKSSQFMQIYLYSVEFNNMHTQLIKKYELLLYTIFKQKKWIFIYLIIRWLIKKLLALLIRWKWPNIGWPISLVIFWSVISYNEREFNQNQCDFSFTSETVCVSSSPQVWW